MGLTLGLVNGSGSHGQGPARIEPGSKEAAANGGGEIQQRGHLMSDNPPNTAYTGGVKDGAAPNG